MPSSAHGSAEVVLAGHAAVGASCGFEFVAEGVQIEFELCDLEGETVALFANGDEFGSVVEAGAVGRCFLAEPLGEAAGEGVVLVLARAQSANPARSGSGPLLARISTSRTAATRRRSRSSARTTTAARLRSTPDRTSSSTRSTTSSGRRTVIRWLMRARHRPGAAQSVTLRLHLLSRCVTLWFHLGPKEPPWRCHRSCRNRSGEPRGSSCS